MATADELLAKLPNKTESTSTVTAESLLNNLPPKQVSADELLNKLPAKKSGGASGTWKEPTIGEKVKEVGKIGLEVLTEPMLSTPEFEIGKPMKSTNLPLFGDISTGVNFARQLPSEVLKTGTELLTTPLTYVPIPGGKVIGKGAEAIAKKNIPVISKIAEKAITPISQLFSKKVIPESKIASESLSSFSNKISEIFDNLKSKVVSEESKGVKKGITSMAEHHKALRDVEFVSTELKNSFNKLNLPIERQELITNALEQPGKYLSQLSIVEKEAYDTLKIARDKLTKYGIDTGLLDKNTKGNYMFHWWLDESGKPYSPMYGKFSRNAPQLKERIYKTREEGLLAGKRPATSNPAELIEKSMVSLTRASSSREMIKTLATTESGIEGALLRSAKSVEAKPLRLIERWDKLQKQGMTDGYERYSHFALDKPITFKDSAGNLHILKGNIGVDKNIFPYVKAYFESPTFGALSKLNFASKSLKLMSGFHVISLEMQALAGGKGLTRIPGLNIIKGLSQIEKGGETLRILYRNGLELKGYADVGGSSNVFEALSKSPKAILKYPGKLLSAVQNFTFDVVHPGVKTSTSLNIFDSIVAKAESKAGRMLTTAEKDNLAKETVNYVNRLFSGEDYKTALLQTNKWMAKYFYSPTARKAWQFSLISPQWQKAHIGIIGDIIKSIATKEGRSAPTAEFFRRYMYSALSIYGIANMYNFAMTKYMDGEGKFMIQNDGHNSFSVRAPYNDPDGRKVYFRPLKSIFEIPELLSDPIGKAIAKLAPWIQTSAEQIKPMPYTKYKGWEGIPKRAIDISKGLGLPMPSSTLFNKSKSDISKALSVVGIPTSKGDSDSELRKKIKEAYESGDNETRMKLINQLQKQSDLGKDYKIKVKEEAIKKLLEKNK